MADWFTPYIIPNSECLSIGKAPSQGLVYAVNENIVVKVPFQYHITDLPGSEAELCRDDSLRSLELLRKEADIYQILAVHLHPNIVRCLYNQPATCLFLERAICPLQSAQAQATKQLRYRWIGQLLSAIAWLEGLGYAHGDLAVQNIGIDGYDCLKLFDFGATTSKTHDTFNHVFEKDHTGLATCLHFLLSGVDPMANAKDLNEVRCIQRELRQGRYPIEPEARILKEVILDGWTGRNALPTFGETQAIVKSIIGAGDRDSVYPPVAKSYSAMEAACVDWLKTATVEQRWLTEDRYRERWRTLGYDIKEGIWGDG